MNATARLFLYLSIAPLLVAQNQFSTDLLALNPLGYWPLHGNANDASTHGNNGTVMNGLAFTGFVGPLGPSAAPAAGFSSARGQFVSMPVGGSSIFNLDPRHPLTAMAWIRTVNTGLGLMIVLAKDDPVVNTGWGIVIDNGDFGGPKGGGRFVLTFVQSGDPFMAVESAVGVNDGGWHLVAATYDGSGSAAGVRLYIDGVSVAAVTVVDAFSGKSMLNSGPLSIGDTADGSLESPFEGNINDAAVFGVALTPAQILQLSEASVGFKRLLPQFAFGGGWYSAVYFTNEDTTAVSFPVNFTGDDGTPLSVPSVGGSSTTVNLPPGGSVMIEAPNVGPLQQGYVSAVLPVGVTGYGVFRQSPVGYPDQEAVVPFSAVLAQQMNLIYDEANFTTAFALVNPTSVIATITITVCDIGGNTIGTSTVVLQPFSKTAAVLRSMPGLTQIVGNRGTVRFSTTAGNIAVLGLRFGGSSFTSIPAFGKIGF